MGSRLAWLPLPALGLGLLWLASTCLAAGPIKGGRYAGGTSLSSRLDPDRRYIAFDVDDQGRAFVSDPRLVFQGSEINAPCATSPWDLGGSRRLNASADYYTISDGTPVRIRPDGTFFLSAAAREGDPPRPAGGAPTRLRLRGLFADSGHLATGSFRISRSPAGRPACTKRGTFRVRFTGQRHLAVGTCSPAKTETLADDGAIRAYRERYVYDPVVRRGYGNGDVIYGCDRATQHRWFLAGDDTSDGLFENYLCAENGGPVALAGSFVAILWESLCEPGVGTANIRIVDMQSGAVRVDQYAPVKPFDRPNQGKALVLAPDGSAAWIVCAGGSTPSPCQVVAAVAFGPNTLLDQGDQIDPKSLSLDGSTLSWRDNGETKTATLG
jgi:hypothetical protein